MLRPLWLRQTLPSKRIAVLGGFCWLRGQDLLKTLATAPAEPHAVSEKPLRPGNSGASCLAFGIFTHSRSFLRRWSSA
jgi:hypothetical protein